MKEVERPPNRFVKGPVARTLIMTSLAMIPGTLSLSLYHVIDAYFVSRLGLDAFAAMGFCLPIIVFVNCIYHGLSTGMMTLLSHAIGKRDDEEASRVIALGLLLVVAVSLVVGAMGAMLIRPLCQPFIETPEVLDYVVEFMEVWFLGNFTISLGMTSNKLLLAMGYTKQASFWMVMGFVINIGLEPLFIFGLGPFPGMGMYGAALATVIAQGITPIGCLYIIQKRRPFFSREAFVPSLMLSYWKRLALFALPATLSIIIMPISGLVAIWIASRFGDAMVAAMAAASRLELIAFVIPMSMGVSLSPMLAQNYAAKQYRRVRQILFFAIRFSVVYLLAFAAIFFAFAHKLGTIFSDDAQVIATVAQYLRIVAWGYAAQEVFRFCTFTFNSCNRPSRGALLSCVRVFVLLIPLSLLAVVFNHIQWLFWGRLLAEMISATFIFVLTRRLLAGLIARGEDRERAAPAAAIGEETEW
ncbi:MAG: MATE family efflux transporter [Proteobacteria bacterium]|nr:MATE family efflux transporter [Pseudomonadota bacterium]